MAKLSNKDPLGRALLDYLSEGKNKFIKVRSSLGEEDNLWVNQFFRTFDEMPKLERMALNLCKGKVLDVGAGGGAHSKYLKSKGLDVLSIDISEGAVQAMKNQNLNAVKIDFFELENMKFDTLLLLMNGVGIVGTLSRLPLFFKKASQLLNEGGQIIFDSSDISYMFEDDLGNLELDFDKYYGEVNYTMEYEKEKGKAFDWLFVNYHTLKNYAEKLNFKTELLIKNSNQSYCCRCFLE